MEKKMVERIKEIETLVETYNSNEKEQNQRLARLFRLVKQGSGYREVRFSSGVWTNCWSLEDRLDKRAQLEPMERMIIGVKPGID